MAITETVTIINNSGKVISTGKQLVNIFKEAKAAYKDKKDAIKAERDPVPGIKRAQTFDITRHRQQYYEQDHYYDDHDRAAAHDRSYHSGRRRSYDDGHSDTSSRRSSSTRRSRRHHDSSSPRSRPALTESNLQTLSEVSASTPSAAPRAYRSPYAETAPRDMALSRPTLVHSATMPMPPSAGARGYPPPAYSQPRGPAAPTVTDTASRVSSPRQSMLVHRPRSTSHIRSFSNDTDTDLAYGNIPPDLESRTDLDLARSSPLDRTVGGYYPTTRAAPQDMTSPVGHEQQATTLMQRIESVLEEVHCLHHTAGAMITHLQRKPEAAAAVALTLAELSTLLTKMSPGFLGVIKGGSPAVFALLASPQFLIGAGVAVGVTVVMFGGWKIVKRMQDAKKAAEAPLEFEMHQQQQFGGPAPPPGGFGFARGAAFGAHGGGYDEALVLEEELSTIESWRRGIAAYGEDGTADLELISPEAERATREQRRRKKGREADVDGDGITPDDSASRSGRSERSSRTHGSGKSRRGHRSGKDSDIPERKSSKGFKGRDGEDDDDGDRRSERSHRSHKSSGSKRTDRTRVKAIEDGRKDADKTVDAVLQKDKKPNMLKTLFKKKKDKDDKDRAETSVLA